jgi:hypothetical protein
MDFLHQADDGLKLFLAACHKAKWMTIRPTMDARKFECCRDIPPGLAARFPQWVSLISKSTATADVLTLGACAALVAHGPKVFHASLEQCESMENVDLKIAFQDYQQSYECMLITFPPEYIRRMVEEFGQCPQSMLVWWMPEMIVVVGQDSTRDGDVIRSICQCGESLEDGLQYEGRMQGAELTEVECRLGLRLERLAMNLCLFLMSVPTEIRYPRISGPRAARREQEILWPAEIKCTVRVRGKGSSGDSQSNDEPSGAMHLRPHWRRGHWRMLIAGAHWKESKRLFIKPVLINAEELSETKEYYGG